jgi:ribonucleoside-diphosphate reductase alpha chain
MKFTRLYSSPDRPVREQVKWRTLDVVLRGKGDVVIFEQRGVEVPEQWSDHAATVLAQKYFRKAGVPSATDVCGERFAKFDNPRYEEEGIDGIPLWLVPKIPTVDASLGTETSAHQVFHRLAGAWTYWGWRGGYFGSEEDAHIFYDETYMMLALQVAAPNSPQWFNTGLYWAYGIEGDANGQWIVDEEQVKLLRTAFPNLDDHVRQTTNAYERPQPHACFLTPIADDLVNPGGIMDLVVREGRIFKHGSGSGINASAIRSKGELTSGGGHASGLMSFLRVHDAAAGAIQSGGTTRRAAKMVCVDMDHPEIEAFIEHKVREEAKAAAMYVGSRVIAKGSRGWPDNEPNLIPQQMFDRIDAGVEPEVFGIGYEGEAIKSVDGQNANDSVRVTDEFLRRVDVPFPTIEGQIAGISDDQMWSLTERTTGQVVKRIPARGLWRKVCLAAWACADPGVIFDDTVNAWHTTMADGRITTTNPCCEFHSNTGNACNLASLRLTAFLNSKEGSERYPTVDIDLLSYEHACRLWTVVLDISNSMASFPAKEFAIGAYNYRTLGLGYADLGGLLMRMALPYDSNSARSLAAGLTALMTGVAYRTSAEVAQELGPFPRWEANREHMKRVLRNHAIAAGAEPYADADYEGLNMEPYEAMNYLSNDMAAAISRAWNAVSSAESFRNAQVTLIAPTGTIALVMDCDTTGVEPDFSLVKDKKLAGGGSMRIVNQAVPMALRRLAYTAKAISSILESIENNEPLDRNRHFKDKDLVVFDTAVGDRPLSPEAHYKMVAAVQPFLSGAVSKTVNLPPTATPDDVDRIYREAHRLGLKSIAIYRDGSKLTQPLSTGSKATEDKVIHIARYEDENDDEFRDAIERLVPIGPNVHVTENLSKIADSALRKSLKIVPEGLKRGERERLPSTVSSVRKKMYVGGQVFYLHTGTYPDGRLGEFFLTMSKEGSFARAMVEGFGKLASIALQHGTPLHKLVDAFTNVRFEPSGIVEGHETIRMCSSILDLVFRDLAQRYLAIGDNREERLSTETSERDVGESHTESTQARIRTHTDYMVSAVGAAVTPGRADGQCWECGQFSLRRDGSCFTCMNCGARTGCG